MNLQQFLKINPTFNESEAIKDIKQNKSIPDGAKQRYTEEELKLYKERFKTE